MKYVWEIPSNKTYFRYCNRNHLVPQHDNQVIGLTCFYTVSGHGPTKKIGQNTNNSFL